MVQARRKELQIPGKDSQLEFSAPHAAAVHHEPENGCAVQLNLNRSVNRDRSRGGHAQADCRDVENCHGGDLARASEYRKPSDAIARLCPPLPSSLNYPHHCVSSFDAIRVRCNGKFVLSPYDFRLAIGTHRKARATTLRGATGRLNAELAFEDVYAGLEISNLSCIWGFLKFLGKGVREVCFRHHGVRHHLHVSIEVPKAHPCLDAKLPDLFLRVLADYFKVILGHHAGEIPLNRIGEVVQG